MSGRLLKRTAKGLAWKLAESVFGVGATWRRGVRGRREVPALSEVQSILAIRLDLMGDVIFTLPALYALREAAPRARISVLVLPYAADLLRGLPFLDRVVAVDVNRWRKLGKLVSGAAAREVQGALSEVRRERYDLCVSFYGRVAASAALLSNARFLVGYQGEGYPLTFDLALRGERYRRRRHESEYCLDLVRVLGVQATAKLPQLNVDPDAAERVRLLLAEEGIGADDRLVALHPGALNLAAKRWIPERWSEVADRVQKELGCRIVLVGSASELPLVEGVARGMGTAAIVLAGKTSVAELVALLARCRLFLGGDSGPLHVASSLGVPSVSVYGPTDPGLTGPLGPRARVLRATLPCSPCYDPAHPSECRPGDLACMARVTVDEVFAAVREVMSGE